MRPTLRLLDDALIGRIVDEARDLLRSLGVVIHNPEVLELLGSHGARIESAEQRVFLTDEIIDGALGTVPRSFKLFDALGNQTHDLSGDNVHFTPGSAAIHVLDKDSGNGWNGKKGHNKTIPHLVHHLTADADYAEIH